MIPEGIFTKLSGFQIDVASTSITDTGSYVITVTVSDDFPSSVTASFTLSITNAAPKVVSVPKDESVVHGSSLIINLASNFADDDGDDITMTATYTRIEGATLTIPNGLFTVVSSPLTIIVSSTSIADTGVYTITLTILDPLLASLTQTFKVSVTNTAPFVTNQPPSDSIVHGKSKSIDLTEYFDDKEKDTLTMTATY
jgi:hypothetical protein